MLAVPVLIILLFMVRLLLRRHGKVRKAIMIVCCVLAVFFVCMICLTCWVGSYRFVCKRNSPNNKYVAEFYRSMATFFEQWEVSGSLQIKESESGRTVRTEEWTDYDCDDTINPVTIKWISNHKVIVTFTADNEEDIIGGISLE
jgi:hypothetical protein